MVMRDGAMYVFWVGERNPTANIEKKQVLYCDNVVGIFSTSYVLVTKCGVKTRRVMVGQVVTMVIPRKTPETQGCLTN